jgi:hypothetical protein
VRFDPGKYEQIICTGVRLKPDSSSDSQPCSLDDDIKVRVADTEARRRRNIILEALREFREHAVTILRGNPNANWKSWVNTTLLGEELPKLTPAEVKEYDS